MNNYIHLIDGEPRTALNSLWAVLKYERYEPDELLLISIEGKKGLEGLVEDFEGLLENYEIDCSVESRSIEEIDQLGEMVSRFLAGEDGQAVLDISAASKYMTAKVLMDSRSDLFDHVFYLQVEGMDEKEKPLPTIEKSKVGLEDLKADSKR
ncbi:MAG: hypothetical protein V5A76_03190 [Candidatus Thermoplasmatota archaeon]